MKGVDARWAVIAILFALLDAVLIRLFEAGSDWSALWAAGRLAWDDPSQIYDFDLISRLQGVNFSKVGFHPYIYPPSALLLFAPFALPPFWISFALFVAASLACLTWTSRRVGSDPCLILLMPPVFIAAIVGQPSLLIIGLVVLAFSMLEKQGGKAGALLAIAALIKPTLLVLAPVGLVAGRHWGALAAAALTGGIGIACSLVLFGIQPWLDWVEAIPKFQQMFADRPPLVRNAVSPYATAIRLGIENEAIILVGAGLAAILAWFAFRRPASPATRSAIVLGGALLLTPYAMNYELAVFGPALLALRRDRLLTVAVVAVWGASLFLNAGVVGLAVAYAAVACPIFTARRAEAQCKSETSR